MPIFDLPYLHIICPLMVTMVGEILAFGASPEALILVAASVSIRKEGYVYGSHKNI